jgi:hypothetical protein
MLRKLKLLCQLPAVLLIGLVMILLALFIFISAPSQMERRKEALLSFIARLGEHEIMDAFLFCLGLWLYGAFLICLWPF